MNATAIRRDLHCPDLPIVVSPLVWPNGKKTKIVNENLRKAAETIAPCRCIDALDPSLAKVQTSNADPCAGHLTAEGVTDIGIRMGEAIQIFYVEYFIL